MRDEIFDPADLEQMRERPIPVEDALAQLRLLRRPPEPVRLDRACTVGDGIRVVVAPEIDDLMAAAAEAARAGRLLKFVPSSGAATRMFHDLLAFRGLAGGLTRGEVKALALEGVGEAEAVLRFMRELRNFAFYRDLWELLARKGKDLDAIAEQGPFDESLDVLLQPHGLGYASLPKGLLKFHRYPEGGRTAFEEHLVEAAEIVADGGRVARVHFTVTADHLDRFEGLFGEVRGRYEAALGAILESTFSCQKPSTDTLAAEIDGSPFRDAEGRLVFRPGGHGALLENLHETGADIVLIKNIDNIQPERHRAATVHWKKILVGLLVRLQSETHSFVRRLREGGRSARLERAAAAFVRDRFGHEASIPGGDPTLAASALISALDRPIRVCGVVRNAGEPGGGPFWVREEDGTRSLQIVESAEVDHRSDEQQRIFASSTHFNPVDLVCGLRDASGKPFDLGRFTNPRAVIITRKSADGRDLLALERPGLWNGAMARWNTVFVEVPPETFTPVKTVFDLLRPEHQSD